MSQIVTKIEPRPGERTRTGPSLAITNAASLREAFPRAAFLWNHRNLLLRAAVAGLVVGLLVAFLLPKRFESTTQLMPPDNQSGAGMAMLAALTTRPGGATGGGGLGAIAGELLGMKNTGALFIGVLRSRTLESRLVERFDLRRVYGKRLVDDACRKLEENTQISEDRKSGILAVTVTDHDPKRAASIAAAYVDELDRLVAELSTSAARRERVFLEGRLAAVKEELDRASKEFSQFASKNTAIDIKEQGKAMLESAAILQGQLIAAQSELQGLEQIYTKNNVRVRASEARIAELKHQIDNLGGKNDAANGEANGDSMYPSIRRLPILGVTYADLYRQTKIQETVLESLTQEYELAKVQEAKEIPSVKVLDAPEIPERKSFPPRLLIISLGLFCGLAVGIVWILGYARWDDLSPADPTRMLGTHVFQVVRSRMGRHPGDGPRGEQQREDSSLDE